MTFTVKEPGRILRFARNRHLLLLDLVMLPLAALLAFVLRLDSAQIQSEVRTMLIYALAAPLIQIPIFAALGIYGRFWQYASIDELLLLAWAALVGGLTQGTLFLGTQALFPDLLVPGVPRSIPLIAILITLVFISGPRFALRVWTQRARRSAKAGLAPGVIQHVLIAGAGEAGVMVLREIQANPQTGLIPIGFVDDDPDKRGALIHRLRVWGDRTAIPLLVREYHVEQVIIAMPSAAGKAIREIVDICEAAGVRARIIPGIYELLAGRVSLQQIRDVQIEDLLRRAPVQIDAAQVATLVHGKRVLVTGAGGSIGSELCRQIVRLGPAELVLLGHGENSIFDIQNEMRSLETGLPAAQASKLETDKPTLGLPASRVTPVIADIRDTTRLAAIFAAHRPELVFHAAAHKHVPLMENNVEEAITNNVLGTRNLVEASVAAGVSHFVLISTDKAVNPSSVMGATKRAAELIVQDAAQRTGRAFVAVRFGNVLGSRGSVVPFFQKQIAAGGPVTVTHPDVKRYFMTIPEAVQLVLQAAALGLGGEIFVLDMGEPVRIVDLARDLIRLTGLEPDRDIEIRYTGLRPGEKLFEELFGADEAYGQTQHEKIFVYRNGNSAAAAEAHVGHRQAARDASSLAGQLDALIFAAQQGDASAVRSRLSELVPEYQATGS
jgi:FlaA1/EpsC-like NDP-sugar epimerase